MAERTRGRQPVRHDTHGLALSDALVLALGRLDEHPELTDLTIDTVQVLWRGLARRAFKKGASRVVDIDAELALDFIRAKNRDGSRPSVATMHLRRWAVRFLFALLRRVGVRVTDPTVDVELPPRSAAPVRPLTDDEVALCRLLATYPEEATLKPAAWGLAEAGATTQEIATVRRADLAGDASAIALPGTHLVTVRTVPLTDFARVHLERRLGEIDGDPSTPLAYTGGGRRPQAAAATVIGKVLRRAGLAGAPGVRPASVRAWSGLGVFRATGSIEAAARHLGVQSLDSAARLLALDWREA